MIFWNEGFYEGGGLGFKIYMNNYNFEYNYEKPQCNRKKMIPVQYRNHLLDN